MVFAKSEEHELAVELFGRVQDQLSSQNAVLPDDVAVAFEERSPAIRER